MNHKRHKYHPSHRFIIPLAMALLLFCGQLAMFVPTSLVGAEQKKINADQKPFSRYFSMDRWQWTLWLNTTYFANQEIKQSLLPGFGAQYDFLWKDFLFSSWDIGFALGGHYHTGQNDYKGENLYFIPAQILVHWRYLQWQGKKWNFALYAGITQGISTIQSSIGAHSASYTASAKLGFQWQWLPHLSWNMEVGSYYLADPVLVTPLFAQTGISYHWQSSSRSTSITTTNK